MSFRLTYATMFDPPEAVHQRLEAVMAEVRAGKAIASSYYLAQCMREQSRTVVE